MSIDIKDFFAFMTFFMAFCTLFLGIHTIWVIPAGLILTIALMLAYYRWISPEEKTTKKKKEEKSA